MNEWPLVGRQEELQNVRRLLSAGGHGGVVLAGSSGVGKTRLAVECLAVASALGYATGHITGSHAARGIPFGAFGALLSDAAPGPPSLGGLAGLLTGARHAIAEQARGRGLALLIDDAHLLDDTSATLTHQLATTRSAFVIATIRAGEVVPDPLVALWKDGSAERIDLRPLCPEAIPALLEAALGGPVDGATVRHLASRCRGNVQFLRELVLGALDADVLREDGGVWRAVAPAPPSDRLVELVETRLRGLSEEERSVLETVAYGEPVGVHLLRSLVPISHLEVLERRGLLCIGRDGQRLEARLAHPVHGDVLRCHMPTMRAEAVRQDLADQVQAFGARRQVDILRVACWRLDGGGALPADLARTAADRASFLCDFDLAERLARAAADAGGGFDSSVFAGWVSGMAGRFEKADQELASLARHATTDAERTMVAVARADNLFMEMGQSVEAMQALDDALATVTDPDCRDELESKRAYLLLSTERPAEALALAERLMDRAQGRGLMEACLVASIAYLLAGRMTAAMNASARGLDIDLPASGSPKFWQPHAHIRNRCEVQVWSGLLQSAETTAREQYEEALLVGRHFMQSAFALALSRVCLAQGRVATAVRWAREAVVLRRTESRPSYVRSALADLAWALALLGDAAEAKRALQELDEAAFPTDGAFWPNAEHARAWTAVAEGDLPAARTRLEAVAGRAFRNGELAVSARALHDLARLGGAADVAERLQDLATQVEGCLVQAWAGHATALASSDAGALEEASARFELLGAVLLAAEAMADAATALRRGGDTRRALAVERRATDLAGRCEGARTPALAPLTVRTTLTAREREVAALAASGLSNREITARLHLSVRTVENQLQRVYEKLGIRSRAELADALGPG